MAIPAATTREQVLGIPFFRGSAAEAVAQARRDGGLVVAPSGTCFERFLEDDAYRRAVLSADLALPDSGLMVILWRLLKGRSIHRISGLAYLQTLLSAPAIERESIFWILPNERARECLLGSSARGQRRVSTDDCYLAPIYDRRVHDEALLRIVEAKRPAHIIIGIGAGPQEKLGWYLREHLSFRPAIHCIGGALGFLTGDQVAIPEWADQLYLGWLLRLFSQPRIFLPRLWRARVLPGLIRRYGATLPRESAPEDRRKKNSDEVFSK